MLLYIQRSNVFSKAFINLLIKLYDKLIPENILEYFIKNKNISYVFCKTLLYNTEYHDKISFNIYQIMLCEHIDIYKRINISNPILKQQVDEYYRFLTI